jgi:class 3 adenylate cyclase
VLLFSALLSIAMGWFVAVVGQERRTKVWFLLLCASTACLSVGLWVEINLPNWAFAAARANMTSAFMIAAMGLMSARAMCGWKLNTTVVVLLTLASVVDIATVWATGIYFTGELIPYRWGAYVAGSPAYAVTPLLITLVAVYGIANLWAYYRQAHPLEKNRSKYLFLANAFLFVAALDFLPHFGVDLFGGPLSGIAIPLFLATYSYAMLRYRLFEFGSFLSRAAGWFLASVLMIIVYALIAETGRRFGAPLQQTYVVAAIAGFLAWLGVGRHLPDWAQRVLARDSDFRDRVQAFGDEVCCLHDEDLLHERLRTLCLREFGASTVEFVDGDRASAKTQGMRFSSEDIIEKEVACRSGQFWPDALSEADVLLPLMRQEILVGFVFLGARADGRQYTQSMLTALRYATNIFTVTLANVRSVQELAKRHQLDRYLAPQIVERVLAGHQEIISTRKRLPITVFFSDLKDFALMADKMDPEELALVLNEYLSAMAEIAFGFGGTLDKFIGDAIMVIFGAPLDSDPRAQVNQCVRMALAMHDRTKELNQEWIERGLLGLGLISRMGVHTGEATVGSFGSDNRVEYTAIGRSVILASRLEKYCTPGRVLVSAECWRFLSNEFRGEARSSIRVKGFAEPVDAYEIDSDAVEHLRRTESIMSPSTVAA